MKKKLQTIIDKTNQGEYKQVVSEMVDKKIQRDIQAKQILKDQLESIAKGKTFRIEVKNSNILFN